MDNLITCFFSLRIGVVFEDFALDFEDRGDVDERFDGVEGGGGKEKLRLKSPETLYDSPNLQKSICLRSGPMFGSTNFPVSTPIPLQKVNDSLTLPFSIVSSVITFETIDIFRPHRLGSIRPNGLSSPVFRYR